MGTVQRYNMGYVSQKRQLKKKKFKKIKGSEQLQRQEGTLPFCGSTVKYFKHEDFSRQFNLKLRQDSPYTNHSLVCIKKKEWFGQRKNKALCKKQAFINIHLPMGTNWQLKIKNTRNALLDQADGPSYPVFCLQ